MTHPIGTEYKNRPLLWGLDTDVGHFYNVITPPSVSATVSYTNSSHFLSFLWIIQIRNFLKPWAGSLRSVWVCVFTFQVKFSQSDLHDTGSSKKVKTCSTFLWKMPCCFLTVTFCHVSPGADVSSASSHPNVTENNHTTCSLFGQDKACFMHHPVACASRITN